MLDKEILNQYRNDAQGLARYFSEKYFKEHEKVFPINPFQVLTDLGIHFVFRNFDKITRADCSTKRECRGESTAGGFPCSTQDIVFASRRYLR